MQSRLTDDLLNGKFSTQTWEDLGFLGGLNDEQKEECATCFTEMAQYLMGEADIEHKEIVETIAFPIIRRAIQHGGGLASFYTPERMCTFMGNTYDAVKRLCNDIGVGDTEAEFCVYISNAFSKNR